jgi:AraC-like DNA-binding protein
MTDIPAINQDERLRVAGGSVFETGDLDQSRDYMTGIFRSHRLDLAGRRRSIAMRHECLRVGTISLHWLRYGSPVVMSAPEMARFYLFQINLHGACDISHGRETALVPASYGYAVDPTRPLSKSWSEDCEQLIIRVDRDRFERFATREIGGQVSGRLAFTFRPHPVAAGAASIANLAAGLHEDALEQRRGLCHPRVGRHLEATIMSLLLSSFPHNLREEYDRAAQPCAPYYVHRAEQFVEAHARDPIDIESLVEAAGVSARSLFGGFRRFRGLSPMAYLKAKRLDLAYADLKAADAASTTVTRIAVGCGFTHMGKFARDFKARFGVSPSAMLAGRADRRN